VPSARRLALGTTRNGGRAWSNLAYERLLNGSLVVVGNAPTPP
jgi:hypothetical protein